MQSRYGSSIVPRDLGGLESALAAPRATFDGQLLHRGLYEVAAAYAFHIIRNHPYLDGNKRVGMMAAIVFLHVNKVISTATEDAIYAAGMDVAQGRMTIAQLAVFFRARSRRTG